MNTKIHHCYCWFGTLLSVKRLPVTVHQHWSPSFSALSQAYIPFLMKCTQIFEVYWQIINCTIIQGVFQRGTICFQSLQPHPVAYGPTLIQVPSRNFSGIAHYVIQTGNLGTSALSFEKWCLTNSIQTLENPLTPEDFIKHTRKKH